LAFQDVTYEIRPGATQMVVEIRAFTTWFNEIVAFDNIRITAGAEQPSKGEVVWVSFHSGNDTPSAAAATAGFTQAPDAQYTRLLAAQGYQVRRVVTADNAGLDAAMLNAADLVIISRSVPSGHYETDPETAFWNGITTPTIVTGGYITRQNRLGLMAGSTIPDTAGTVRLAVNNPSHPIFQGVALDAANTMVNPYAHRVMRGEQLQRGISVVTGATAGNGTLLATIGTAGDPAVGGLVIGEWQAGATLSTAPPDTLGGRRLVFLTGSREADGLTSEGSGMFDLDQDGQRMFLNAVAYMIAPAPGTLAFSSAVLSNGSLRLEWTGGGTLEGAASVTGPWTPVGGASTPHTVTAEGPARFFRLRQ
jgi:hypothetical protein